MINWLKRLWNLYTSGLSGCKLKRPSNLDEAIYALDKMLMNKALIQLKTEEDIVACSHHTLGRWLRNNWGLWDENSKLHKWFKSQGIWHADDMSTIIIKSYYRKAKGLPIKLQDQIQSYIEYWQAQKK